MSSDELGGSRRARKLGLFIKEARERKGLSQRRLAKRIGRSGTYVSRLEAGNYKSPELTTLAAIANVLDLEFAQLAVLASSQIPEDLISLPIYLRRKYGLDAAAAQKLAHQFTNIIADHFKSKADDLRSSGA